MSATGAAQHAVALLRTDSHDPAEVELALDAVVNGGPAAVSAFCLSFGPRHLMKAIGNNRLTDRAAELADELLTACDGVGLTRDVDFGDVHRDQLYPDEVINLSVREAPVVPGVTKRLPLHLMRGQAAFATDYCDIVHSGDHADSPTHLPTLADDPPADPVLRLRNPSRRERLGSEIECKVWPSAIILGRWLCRHTGLLKGQRVLELGSGVGACGLAAALGGAHRVVLTDINAPALALARLNAAYNGEAVAAATAVAHLDWAEAPIEAPPLLDTAASLAPAAPHYAAGAGAGARSGSAEPCAGCPSEAEVAGLLRGRFELILAADVINGEGLSELVFEIVRRYLAPHGLFLMVCPKPLHRHTVERIKALLLGAADLSVEVAAVPEWLRYGIEEAEPDVVQHELTLVQWRDPSLAARAAASTLNAAGSC